MRCGNRYALAAGGAALAARALIVSLAQDLFANHVGAARHLHVVVRAPDAVEVVVIVRAMDPHPQRVWRGWLSSTTTAAQVMLRFAPHEHSLALHDARGRLLDAHDSLREAGLPTGSPLVLELRVPDGTDRRVAVVGLVLARESGVLAAAGQAFATSGTPLRAGEDVAGVTLRFSAARVINGSLVSGSLTLTPLRLLFDPLERSTYGDATDATVAVPLRSVYRMAPVEMGTSTLLKVTFRSGRGVVFRLPAKCHARRAVVDHWQRYCVQPFALLPSTPASACEHEMRWLHDQYVHDFGGALTHSLRISSANAAYEVCGSYPSLVVVPATISDDQLRGCADFRSRSRFPAIVWRHSSGALLARSSQPLVGLRQKRSADDEAVVAAIQAATGSLVLIDSRPVANAVANKLAGAGSERSASYQNCEIRYVGLANIHALRESWVRLMSLGQADPEDGSSRDDQWFLMLHDSGWLQLVRHLLEGATMVARTLDCEGRSCLTHCSDGWDRTAQLSSLAQLLLDPHFRTLDGFARLVHKEWLAFGHRFDSRTGAGALPGSTQERDSAPVFLLFLDCIHQVVEQFPHECTRAGVDDRIVCLLMLARAVEFGSEYLAVLLEVAISGEFGTFLFDNEKERVHAGVYSRSGSVWSHLRARYAQLRNPSYQPRGVSLYPSTRMCHLRLWTRVHNF